MIAATLFSGIGAPEVAMPHWQWAWHAEIEKFPSAVMAARHPQSVNLGDVTANDFTDRARSIARPNVLVFGSPCQSFSVAGKRLGLDDPRGNLALVALGIVDRLKPDWFVFENVPGLLSSGGGRDFGAFSGQVDELRYSLTWARLDAQHFGVAQRRERVFAVGHLGDWRYSAAILLEPESVSGDRPPRRQAREDVTGTLSARTGAGGGLGTDFDIGGGVTVSHCLNAGAMGRIDAESETLIPTRRGGFFDDVSHALRADGFDASEDGTGRGTPIIAFSSKDYGADAQPDLSPTLRAGPHDTSHPNAGIPPAIVYQCQGNNVGEVGTLRKGNGNVTGGVPFAVALRGREGGGTAEMSEVPSALRASGGGGGDKAHVLTNAVRRLTPEECETLQGFRRGYTAITYRNKPAADGPRYKACGNSMAVPVVRWILNRIEIFETQIRPRIEKVA